MPMNDNKHPNNDFPGFDRFYLLHDPFWNKAFRGGWNSNIDAFRLLRSEITITEPITIPWQMGGDQPTNIIRTTMGYPVILSKKIVDLFLKHNISGWKTYEIELLDKKKTLIQGYFGLSVTGRCDSIDLSKSTIVLHQYPARKSPRFKGHYFDPKSWDGSDIFMERPDEKGNTTASILVTQRVKDLFEKEKIRNVKLERLGETETDLSVYEIGLQYKLPTNYKNIIKEANKKEGESVPKDL